MRITAYFYGDANDPKDRACRSIFEAHGGGRYIGSGTMLVGRAQGERDIEYDVPDDQAEHCRQMLKQAGFRLAPTPA